MKKSERTRACRCAVWGAGALLAAALAGCAGSGVSTGVYVGVAGPGPWYGYPGYGYPGMVGGGVVIGRPAYPYGRYRDEEDDTEDSNPWPALLPRPSPAPARAPASIP
jgi:hypothetical protein